MANGHVHTENRRKRRYPPANALQRKRTLSARQVVASVTIRIRKGGKLPKSTGVWREQVGSTKPSMSEARFVSTGLGTRMQQPAMQNATSTLSPASSTSTFNAHSFSARVHCGVCVRASSLYTQTVHT